MEMIGGELTLIRKKMSSMRNVGSRIGKTKVRFELKVALKQLVLPRVTDGAKIFVLLERGRHHKSWTGTHTYKSSKVSSNSKYVEEWASENLKVPITLYRGAQGNYQPKAFQIKIMKDPSAKPADFPSSDNPVLATFILDATKFRVMSENDSPGTIRVSCSSGKGCIKDAKLLVSVACVFDHESTGDTRSVGSSSKMSGYSGNNSLRSNGSFDYNDESEFEQDLSGFGDDEVGEKRKWWQRKASTRSSTSFSGQYESPHGNHKGQLENVAEVRESMEALSYDDRNVLSTRSGGNGGGGGIINNLISGLRISTRDGNHSLTSADVKMQHRAEKEAHTCAVAELLRGIGLQMYIRPIVIDLGFEDYDVIRSLQPHEFVTLTRDAGMKPGHATKLRLRLGISRPRNPEAEEEASRTECTLLIGRWIDVKGIGVGKVISFNKVWNHLLNHSYHVIDFSYGGKNFTTSSLMEISRQRKDKVNSLKEVSLLLRRRKLGQWNHGLYFEIISDPTI